MPEVKAKLSTYRQSPRKVRMVAKLVRGKRASEALTLLKFATKKTALPMQKLIASAIANAKNLSMSEEDLVIKELKVDEGRTLYRRRPRSRGMANPIRKRTSHISVTLAEATNNKQSTKNKNKDSIVHSTS